MSLEDRYPSFFDELQKIAERAELSPTEQLKELGQFGALGAVATPAISMASNRMSLGKWIPPGSTFKRFIPTGMAMGAVTGGALPAARLYLARKNLEDAKDRIQSEREAKSLASTVIKKPGDVEKILKVNP